LGDIYVIVALLLKGDVCVDGFSGGLGICRSRLVPNYLFIFKFLVVKEFIKAVK
jgi:hypothetical protein